MGYCKHLKTGLLGAALSALVGSAAFAQDVTLRMHHFLPPQAPVPTKILDVWADRVEEASGGAVKVDRFPAMQLGGKPPELMDQVLDGVVDLAWVIVGYTPGRFPSSEVFELPFFANDTVAASSAFWQLFEKHMKDGEFSDAHVLATWVAGPGVIHSKEPIREPSDMDGLKLRGPSRLLNQLLAELGATAVGLPAPAIPEALSKGVIDGTLLPWEVTGALKVPELVKNHTEFEGQMLNTVTMMLVMNKDSYANLSDELKAVIDANSGLEFSIYAGQAMVDADVPGRAAASGNNIITITDSTAWQAATASIYDSWSAELTDKGLDPKMLIEDAKAFMTAYGK